MLLNPCKCEFLRITNKKNFIAFTYNINGCRGDYKVAEMIGQKSSIAINLLNLVGHPYIALKR